MRPMCSSSGTGQAQDLPLQFLNGAVVVLCDLADCSARYDYDFDFDFDSLMAYCAVVVVFRKVRGLPDCCMNAHCET
jgi:hypothetical protein